MKIAVDVSPLVTEPRRGVARALSALLTGLEELAAPDVEIVRRTSRGMVGVLPRVRTTDSVDVWLSPWSAFPRVSVPIVVTVHELPFVRLGPIEGRWRTWNHRRWLARDVARANRIVVPSDATRDDVLALHPEAADRVRVVPHGFVPLPTPTRGRGERETGTSSPGAQYALVVGGRGPRKGMDVWLDARRRLGDTIAWTLVGAPPLRVARAIRGDARVRVVDEPSDAELAALLAESSVLVYPSLSEGFGFPPLEAMAAGVPVVATTAGSIPQVCGDAALLVAPGDAVALADAVARVRGDDVLAKRLVEAGRVRCRAFPPRAAALGVLAALREAIEEGPR